MMKQSRPLSRKDIAQIVGVSVKTIERNEVKLGLDAARYDINARVVLYHPEIVREQLIAHEIPFFSEIPFI